MVPLQDPIFWFSFNKKIYILFSNSCLIYLNRERHFEIKSYLAQKRSLFQKPSDRIPKNPSGKESRSSRGSSNCCSTCSIRHLNCIFPSAPSALRSLLCSPAPNNLVLRSPAASSFNHGCTRHTKTKAFTIQDGRTQPIRTS